MSYATLTDITRIYGDGFLTDLLPRDVEEADGAAAIAQALEDASAEIDGYLSVRYTLPLASPPKVLRRPCIDIGAFILGNSHARLTNEMRDRYKHAIDLLEKIADGKVGLGQDEPRVDSGGGDASSEGASFQAEPRRFGRGRM